MKMGGWYVAGLQWKDMQRANLKNPPCLRQAVQQHKKDERKQVRQFINVI